MDDLKKANVMVRVLTDMRGEGKSVAALSKRYNLSEESINTVLGIKPEKTETGLKIQSRSIVSRFRNWLGC
jgi:Mor family transcriptional regulator